MRNGKVYWIKQKVVGILLIVLPVLFMDLLIETEAVVCVPFYWLFGFLFLIEKDRIFRSDYIFNVGLFIRRIRRRNKMRRMRSGRL